MSVRVVRPRPLDNRERIPVFWAGQEAPDEIKAVDGGALYRYLLEQENIDASARKRSRPPQYKAPKEVGGGRRSPPGLQRAASRRRAQRRAAGRLPRCLTGTQHPTHRLPAQGSRKSTGAGGAGGKVRALQAPCSPPCCCRRATRLRCCGPPLGGGGGGARAGAPGGAAPRAGGPGPPRARPPPPPRRAPRGPPGGGGGGRGGGGGGGGSCRRRRAAAPRSLGAMPAGARAHARARARTVPCAAALTGSATPRLGVQDIHVPGVRIVEDYAANERVMAVHGPQIAGDVAAAPYVRYTEWLPGMYDEHQRPADYDVESDDEAFLAKVNGQVRRERPARGVAATRRPRRAAITARPPSASLLLPPPPPVPSLLPHHARGWASQALPLTWRCCRAMPSWRPRAGCTSRWPTASAAAQTG